MEKDIQDRRPIRARETRWATAAARYLRRKGYTPNTISLFSILFAALGALCFLIVWRCDSEGLQRVLLIVGALAIQGRLLCNLLDGMVAVEGGMCSASAAPWRNSTAWRCSPWASW